ncbi:TaqI-like C-terminal specificity domain-containing protein, partial [Empedobacter falsenii]
LLRGRDIKRYSYDFADLYIITTFPSLKIDIELYPAVKEHLLSFGYDRLKQTGDIGSLKKTNNKWFETQDSISYWDDFSKQKIVYPNMTKFLPFVLDYKSMVTNQKCYIITGENIEFLAAFLNSNLFKVCFKDNFPELQGGTRELSKIFFEKIPIIKISSDLNESFKLLFEQFHKNELNVNELNSSINSIILSLYNLKQEEIEFINSQ